MKHNPTTEELEHAVTDVLQKSTGKELSAKEVRDQLVKEKGEWKVPAERRIAKFVKRQKASDSSRNGFFGRFFGSGKKKSPPTGTQESHPRNNDKEEADPSMSKSERERKGLRSSITKVFSPGSSKKKTAGGTPESVQTTNSKTGGGGAEDISVMTTETAVGEKSAAATTEASGDQKLESSPALETGTPTTEPAMDGDKAEEVESGEGNEDVDQLIDQITEKGGTVDHAAKEVVTEAYKDDNDGNSKGDCACGACIMM